MQAPVAASAQASLPHDPPKGHGGQGLPTLPEPHALDARLQNSRGIHPKGSLLL